jgi:hypothetical protein
MAKEFEMESKEDLETLYNILAKYTQETEDRKCSRKTTERNNNDKQENIENSTENKQNDKAKIGTMVDSRTY